MPDTPTDQLLSRFVQLFLLDDRTLHNESDPLPPELDAGRDDSPYAHRLWQPAKIPTNPAALNDLYKILPAPFPPLYEQLILNYRWLRVDLGDALMLLANPPAPTFTPLLDEILHDPILTRTLLPAGLVPFAHASSCNYDPICFDTTRPLPDGDFPILRLEHESILCHDKIGDTTPIADSFHALITSLTSA